MQFTINAKWDMADAERVCAFMAQPNIYWSVMDRLSPQPENYDFKADLMHPQIATYIAKYEEHVVGYVQFVRRTSIAAEMHVAFHPAVRGRPVKIMTLLAMKSIFREAGLLKLYSPIPSDNRPAAFAARHIGMRLEGTLTKAIVRESGLRDLWLFAITKEEFLKRSGN